MRGERYDYMADIDYVNRMKRLVLEIANNSPIRVDDYSGTRNLCKYCGVSWAESFWDEYARNGERLFRNPKAVDIHHFGMIAHVHHEPDCLWVKANKIIRDIR